MRLYELVECADCLEVDAPTVHGRCSTCGSAAITWVSRTIDQPEVPVAVVHESIVLDGIEREFLRDMGVSW